MPGEINVNVKSYTKESAGAETQLEEVDYRFWPSPRNTLDVATDSGITAGTLDALILHYTVGV